MTGIRRVGSDSTLLIVVNSHTDVVPFTLPEAVGGSRWVRLIDSSDPNGEPLALRDFGHGYDVPSRALLIFLLQPTRTRDRATAADAPSSAWSRRWTTPRRGRYGSASTKAQAHEGRDQRVQVQIRHADGQQVGN